MFTYSFVVGENKEGVWFLPRISQHPILMGKNLPPKIGMTAVSIRCPNKVYGCDKKTIKTTETLPWSLSLCDWGYPPSPHHLVSYRLVTRTFSFLHVNCGCSAQVAPKQFCHHNCQFCHPSFSKLQLPSHSLNQCSALSLMFWSETNQPT